MLVRAGRDSQGAAFLVKARQLVGATGDRHDLGALSRESERGRATDSPPGARDQGDASSQFSHPAIVRLRVATESRSSFDPRRAVRAFEKSHDLVVAGGAEILVSSPDGPEKRRLGETHDLVGDSGEPLSCVGPTHGHREDEPPGVTAA